MTKSYNFNQPILDLSGKPFLDPNKTEVKLGSMLAPALSDHNQGDALKFYSWAIAIYKGDDLVLDKSDQITLREFVNDSLKLNNLVKAQILNILIG